MKKNIKSVIDFLKHPLLLLVIGALISSYIIPVYTSQWQDYQKELELKTDVSTKISESVAKVISISWIFLNPLENPDYTQKDFDNAYNDWIVSSSVIASEIHVYYKNPSLSKEWDNYATILNDFLNLVVTENVCKRYTMVYDIHTFFYGGNLKINDHDISYCVSTNNFHLIDKSKLSLLDSSTYNIDWSNIVDVKNSSTYLESLSFLKQTMMHHKDAIIEEILGLDIPGIYKKL